MYCVFIVEAGMCSRNTIVVKWGADVSSHNMVWQSDDFAKPGDDGNYSPEVSIERSEGNEKTRGDGRWCGSDLPLGVMDCTAR